VRRSRSPRVVDRFLVPATAEPLLSCTLAGSAEFQEREVGDLWVTRQIQRGAVFVTRSKTPYELRWSSPDIPIEALAALVELSSFHFFRVFKQTTGMTPLQFVIRERISRAQQFIRETSRSVIEIGLEVGYTSPSHFAQVFRRIVGVTPTEFRSAL
jgi:AraC family transcriptional regulator